MKVIINKGTIFYQGKFQQLGRMVIDKGKILEITLASAKVKKAKADPKEKTEGNAMVIEADGKYVMPGMIDAHTHLGLEEEGVGWIDADLNESFGLVTPQVRAFDAVKMRDRAFKDALAGGITTCMITPGSANPIGGQTCILKMVGNVVEEAVVKESSGMKFAFGENPKRVYAEQKQFPSTRMGTAAVIREWLMKAQDYSKKKKAKDFKEREIKLEALLPLLEGKIQARAHAHLADDIITAYRIAQEFNLDLVIDHCTEGHLIAKELGRWKARAVVGPTLSSRCKPELRHKTFDTVRALLDEGCMVAITTDHPVIPIEGLSLCAALCVRHGLEEERAIKTVTEYPAAILGLDKRLGKLEVGYDADVVVWNGHPLDVRSTVDVALIDGKKVL
ncbi:MAG: amidohydrolase [Candidatus Ozemobacter sibiricus]|jgi:imidazolonepropionase-like amidohydrolase|uniref:Amidohydrolase n=1 Tax=Candidatus Ozemobacter sibiricus TaxID=2268124 RepID=A0A367ZLI3_9BACT|nr:MAG: amidohydrolase [Candidatus Ozemobacter sibiricus]